MSGVKESLVSTVAVTKSYSGVTVLINVDFHIYPGEVHALIGENGAGKSTLVKMISGVAQPTNGTILIDGVQKRIKNPHEAANLGIVLIHQEPLTFQDLNVTENIFIGHTCREKTLVIDWKKKQKEARELLDSLGVAIDEKAQLRGMSIADQQMVEITSALSQNAKVIIMDEPTAALSAAEVQKLFEIIKKLKDQGNGIVLISHRLEEIMEISDRITVLRDGEKVFECMTQDEGVNIPKLVQMMIGRTYNELIVKEKSAISDEVLRVENLTLPGKFYDISLTVNKGEIVGMAGLVGAGRTEVVSAIFGAKPALHGKILVNGKEANIKHPRDAVKCGVVMVPEDRAQTGLLLPFSIRNNMTFAIVDQLTRLGLIKRKQEDGIISDYTNRLAIKLRTTNQAVRELSGGNQQKVVLSKWLMTMPDILILDEPTRGIDVGAKAEVYKLINKLAQEGKAILMVSSELPEIHQLCDRVYVMCEGHITAEFSRDDLDSEKIMAAASSANAAGMGMEG